MGGLAGLILGVGFPAGTGKFPWVGDLVYKLVAAMHGGGVLSYGLAIIFFTLIIKLIMLPLDFGNRYFTKKNTMKMAEIKPEEEKLKELHKDDPVTLNRERKKLYTKHGYGIGGFCAFTLLNLVVTLVVFLSVFNALRSISNFNINQQFVELQAVYETHTVGGVIIDEEAFAEEINQKYKETRVSFLWVHNIWRPDTWASKNLSWNSFKSAVWGTQDSVFKIDYVDETLTTQQIDDLGLREEYAAQAKKKKQKQVSWWTDARVNTQYNNEQRGIEQDARTAMVKDQYEEIYGALNDKNTKGWNGMLFLVLLAAVTTYLSAMLNAKITAKSKPSEKNESGEVGYGIRDAKEKTNPTMPSVDPKMMNNILKFVLPLIMVYFTISSTAALAIYIIASSIFSTAFTIGLNYGVEKLIKWQDSRRKEKSGDKETDMTIINPHAKYFKNKGQKEKK